MTKICWNKKLDIQGALLALGCLLAFSWSANAGMEITYKRSGAPLAKKQAAQAPVKIVYIKTKPTVAKKSVVKAQPKTTRLKAKTPTPLLAAAVPPTPAPVGISTSTMSYSPPAKKAAEKNWSVSSNITYTRSLIDHQDGTLGAFMDFSAGGSYRFEAMKIGATLYASRDMKAEETTLDDLIVSGSLNPIKTFNDNISVVPFATIGPAASKSDQYASLIAKTKIGTKISLDSEKLGLGKFGIDSSLDVRKNFHEFTTSKEGKVNTEWASLQTIGVSYGFTEKLSAAFNIVHLNTWSYNGIQAEYFTHSQEIAYAVSKNLNISGGHQMGYPFVASYKANGTDRDFDLIDENDSMFFVNVGVSY